MAAGCAAALALADRGLNATIIEAKAQLGGRAFSRALPGDSGPPVEYGGGWGHVGQPRVQALAARLGIALIPRAPLTLHRYLRDGGVHDTRPAARTRPPPTWPPWPSGRPMRRPQTPRSLT